MRNEIETKRNETKPNEIKQNGTKPKETKRNVTSFRFVSFDFVSFRFVSISFRTLQVPIDNARFYYFVRINIQGRVCLNVTIRDCWKKNVLTEAKLDR